MTKIIPTDPLTVAGRVASGPSPTVTGADGLPSHVGTALFAPALDVDRTWRMAKALAYSPLLPPHFMGSKDKKFTSEEVTGNVFLAMVHGHEVGLSAAQSLQTIAVIKGKTSIFGDGLLAVLTASGQFDLDGFKETVTGVGDAMVAKCTMKRVGKKARTEEYGMKRVKALGLTKNPLYASIPEVMLKWRARHECSRVLFPDILKGMGIVEVEQDDAIEVIEGEVVDTSEGPADTAQAAVEGSQPPETAEAAPAPLKTAPQASDDLDDLLDGDDIPDDLEAVNAAVEFQIDLVMNKDGTPDWRAWYKAFKERIVGAMDKSELAALTSENDTNLAAFEVRHGSYYKQLKDLEAARLKELKSS